MLVECQLARLVMRDHGESQLVYVREKGGGRMFPIVIGLYEAAEISRKLREEVTARPLTHDLLRQSLTTLGTRISRVVVDDIRDDVFHAKLHLEYLEREDDSIDEIDCRPSDALALAVATGAPIFVDEKVLDRMSRSS